MTWKIDNVGQFFDCGEPTVIYFDPITGDTHLISDFAAYLIQHILLQPAGLDEIVTQITPDIDPEDLSASIDALPAVLDQLASLDIIERV